MITIINNQPIRLRNSNEIDDSCDCTGQSYCQLINKFDETQFQIKSSNIIINGDFETDLDGWSIFEAIYLTLEAILNPTSGECDGEIEVSVTGGTHGYTYYINGGIFQASPIFSDLCEGQYFIIAKDSEGNEGVIEFYLESNIDCSDFANSTTDDLLPYNTNNFLNCNTDNFI